MNAHVGRSSTISLGARSLLAFVLEPKAPLGEWLEALDDWLARTPNFFSAKPVMLQMGGLDISLKEYRDLLSKLALRHIRVMAVENSSRTLVGPHLPPVVSGGRPANPDKLIDEPAPPEEEKPVEAAAPAEPEPAPAPEPEPAPEPQPAPTAQAPEPPAYRQSLYHDGNLRSGQKLVHLDGDITVRGRVASGAEIVAGGCVHIYGALQGRVFAGVAGAADARIFCREARAELMCIGEAFVTAEDMDPKLEGAAVEARLDGGKIKFRTLN